MKAGAFVRLYLRCLKKAFPGAWAATWIASAIAAIACGTIAVFVTLSSALTNGLMGLVPLAVFLALMIAGPLLAALKMIHELEAQNAVLSAKLQIQAAEAPPAYREEVFEYDDRSPERRSEPIDPSDIQRVRWRWNWVRDSSGGWTPHGVEPYCTRDDCDFALTPIGDGHSPADITILKCSDCKKSILIRMGKTELYSHVLNTVKRNWRRSQPDV